MLTRTSVVCADRIVATSNSHGLRWSSSQTASGYSIGQPSGDLAGPSLRRSRLGHPVTRSFATVAIAWARSRSDEPPATTRRLDAASALNVQRLLDDAARADGFVGLSDQLAADLDDLIGGGAARTRRRRSSTTTPARSPASAIASRRDGDWTMQAVTDPRPPRRRRATRRLVEALLADDRRRGWRAGRLVGVRADRRRRCDRRRAVGFRADRELLQMRRALPAERRAGGRRHGRSGPGATRRRG